MEREGAGIVTNGELRRIEVPAGPGQAARAANLADAALTALGVDGAVIAAALPFAGDAPAHLLLPERVRITSIAPPGTGPGGGRPRLVGSTGAATAGGPRAGGARRPPVLRLLPGPDRTDALAGPPAAHQLRRGGRRGHLADPRRRAGEGGAGPEPGGVQPGIEMGALLAELRRRDPGCHLFAAPGFAAAEGDFVGATPETLIRREGDRVLSLPHAGTAARSPDPTRDRQAAEALLRSAKNRHEHAAVVEAVADALQPHCAELWVDPEPHLAATATVWHLATAVRGRLRPSAPGALSLAAALHPTPAVCGTPTAAAAELIAELEPGSRGLYAGLVGWVDSRGDGEWAVSLRCALVTRAAVRIHAGAGIVAESQPELEVAETDVKFRTLIDALEACSPAAGGTSA